MESGGRDNMDTELDQAVQSCLDLLQSLPIKLDQHLTEVVSNHSQLEDRYKAKEAALLSEIAEIDSKLQEIKNQQHVERVKASKLTAEYQRLKEERKQQESEADAYMSVLREKIDNTPLTPAEEIDKKSAQLREEIEYLGSKLSLYCSSTRIRWDYDHPSSVAGTILGRNQNKPFDFPLQPGQKTASFDQINQLWDLMD